MMKPRLPSSLSKKVLFIAALMALCGITLVALAIITPSSYPVYSSATDPNVIGGAPMVYWYPQQDQFSVKNAAGTFEVKSYIVTGLKFYLFYVVQTGQPANQLDGQPNSQPKDFQLAGFSSTDRGFTLQPKADETPLPPSPTSDLKRATPLPIISNRVIATFNNVDVRLAILDVPDQPQQLITFQATLPDQPGATLELTPVQQIDPIRDSQTLTGGTGLPDRTDSPAYTDVRVDFPIFGYENNQIGVMKISSSNAATPPLYYQVDQQGNLNPFSQADCSRMFPPYPTNPPPKDNGPVTPTIAIPAPCNANS
jgi:hypothetical protein